MKQLTITLSDEAYQQLLSEAESKQKSLEELVFERITTDRQFIGSAKQAQTEAAKFLRKHAGKILRVGNAELDLSETPLWHVSILPNSDSVPKSPLGTISICVFSGEILTEPEEIDRILKAGLELLGLRRIPKEKQSRLSKLMRLMKEERLSEEEAIELEGLLAYADAQELKGLRAVKEKLLLNEENRQ